MALKCTGKEMQRAMLQQFVLSFLAKAPNHKMLISDLAVEINDTFSKSIRKLTGLERRDFFKEMERGKAIEIVSESFGQRFFEFAVLSIGDKSGGKSVSKSAEDVVVFPEQSKAEKMGMFLEDEMSSSSEEGKEEEESVFTMLRSMPFTASCVAAIGDRIFAIGDLMCCCHTQRYCVFDVVKNKWKDFVDFEIPEDMASGDEVMVYDEKRDCLWMHSYDHTSQTSQMVKISFGDTDESEVKINLPGISIFPVLALADGDVHIVSAKERTTNGIHCINHIRFDPKTGNVRRFEYDTNTLDGFDGGFFAQKMVLSKSANQLLLFGTGFGRNDGHGYDGNMLLSFSLDSQKWKVLKPKKLNAIEMDFFDASIVASTDGRFVFIMRGTNGPHDGESYESHCKHMVVYDVENGCFRKSTLKLPPVTKRKCDAVIVRDRMMESLLTFGYIRESFASADFKSLPLMPEHIMKLMSQWICKDFMHVLEMRSSNGQHFRMGIDEIMSSLNQ